MSRQTHYVYYGDGRTADGRHPDAPRLPEPYVVSADLQEAVNTAIYLRRPLLVLGAPGMGKTRLAYSVAYELGRPLYVWRISPTSIVQDGKYIFNALRRAQDLQYLHHESDNRRTYVDFGPLGRAFIVSDGPAVLLIDNLDRAKDELDLELSSILEEPAEFTIVETGETVTANHFPIVIITSQDLRKMSPVLSSRCVRMRIPAPTMEELYRIAEAHFPDIGQDETQRFIVEQLIYMFAKWRDQNRGPVSSTRVFIDALKLLRASPPGDVPIDTRIMAGFAYLDHYEVQPTSYSVNEVNELDKIGIPIDRSIDNESIKTEIPIDSPVRFSVASALQHYFDRGEIQSLCFNLGIDPENIKGETKNEYAIHLVQYCARRNQLLELQTAIRSERPNVSFGSAVLVAGYPSPPND